jgi:hypothetical protein
MRPEQSHFAYTLRTSNFYKFHHLLIDSSFYFSTFHRFSTAMSEKQPSKRRRTDKSSHRDKSSSRRMEDDLNRSSFRSGDAAGRPPPDKDPRTAAADPYVPPMGYESHREASSARPQASNETSHGATPVQPLVGNETGQVAPTWILPQEGNAAPVADVPAGQLFDGSYADTRGAVPMGTSMG